MYPWIGGILKLQQSSDGMCMAHHSTDLSQREVTVINRHFTRPPQNHTSVSAYLYRVEAVTCISERAEDRPYPYVIMVPARNEMQRLRVAPHRPISAPSDIGPVHVDKRREALRFMAPQWIASQRIFSSPGLGCLCARACSQQNCNMGSEHFSLLSSELEHLKVTSHFCGPCFEETKH
jgi:hypothetical protein